ncbi:o-succinylbenzoate--CoA ligase [Amycolatopsis sp. EV170708-02-1]|uniref:o-succinylbenzoate--CoA ligase n=1 Tax=Amycolatopsis sp. EV170708-02-1 TaxID=2919322 RepID=UPI001F0C1E48|nr:o-succinylbenzoate--CoA ligase [Amycolatopsis sp. EV170708-02-1]UMO99956.1 o-succinylbenzoate--CoA ligase [Amycolatopsis sp. EV170708-02-1]
MCDEGIGGWPARRARISPGRTALLFEDEPTTYAQLSQRIAKLASRLNAAGVRQGDRVAYLGPNHPSFVETLFATTSLGAIFVPINFRLSAPEVEHVLTDSGATVLIHAPRDIPENLTVRTVALDDYEAWLTESGVEPAAVTVAPDDVALILYTSGTTGRPKGATLTHANLLWNTFNLLIGVDVAGDEVALVTAPLFHIAALAQTLLPTLIKGGCALLTPSWDVDGCFDLIERHRVTWMFGVTTMYAALAASPRWPTADLSSVRSLLCGGASVPEELVRTYQRRGLVFCQGYGMTETAPGVTFLEARESRGRAGSAGVPVFFADVRLDTPGTGEIQVKGPNVSPGYWRNRAATAAAFTEDGWFRTGDLATVDEDGHYRIVDRLKDMFISGGENVYPAEVENALFEHPAVTETAVIGVPDKKWGEVGYAFVVPSGDVSAGDLRDFLLGRLAKYKVPARFEFVERLPRTASGKVRKSELRARY